MQFNSSIAKCVFSFFRQIILMVLVGITVLILISWLTVGSDGWRILDSSGIVRTMILRSLGFSILIGVVLSGFVQFYLRRIRIEVTENAVAFYRGKREYAYFHHASFIFSGLVHVERAEGVIPFSYKFLRVIMRYGRREKKYRCYNFDTKTFSDLISHVRASMFLYEQMHLNEKDYYGDDIDDIEEEYTPPEDAGYVPLGHQAFDIDRVHLIQRQRSLFVRMLLFCFLPAFIIISIVFIEWLITPNPFLWDDIRSQPGLFIVTFLMVLTPLIITGIPPLIYGSRYFQIKRITPSRIESFSDRLIIDGEVFHFSQVKQIRMTAPSVGDGDFHIKRRFLTIISDSGSRKFILSDSRDIEFPKARPKKAFPKAFVKYHILYDALQGTFESEPSKFVSEF